MGVQDFRLQGLGILECEMIRDIHIYSGRVMGVLDFSEFSDPNFLMISHSPAESKKLSCD
jgi:hypothetical protein